MLLKLLFVILPGKLYWDHLRWKYHILQTEKLYVFPEYDEEINKIAFECLHIAVEKRFYTRLCFLTVRNGCKDKFKEITVAEKKVIEISDRMMEYIIYYFMFHAKDCTIVSFTKPEGRNTGKAIGAGGVTREELMKRCIFQIL